jgi:type II secretory pathway component GspD/PulD (secretin)
MTPRPTLLALCLLAPCLLAQATQAATPTVPATPAAAQSAAAAAPSASRDMMSYTFRDRPIEELFNMIARTARINIVLARGVSGNVSISLYDLTVRQAIEAIAEAGGYSVSERPGSFLISDAKTAQQELARTTQVRAMKVRYTDIKKAGEILTRQLGLNGTVTVLESNKTLVVESTEAGLARAARVLREIDGPPQQILIEAKILEITLDRGDTYGVDWSRVFNANGPDTVGTTGFAAVAGPRFFFNVVNNNIQAHLTALTNKGRVHTLATPRLLAMEDQEASTNVGDQIGYRLTTTINNVTTESIQFLETGVILRVTPSIDSEGRIAMKIRPEVSSGSVSAGIPSKKTTEVNTQLIARDGQPVLIGGLIKSSSSFRRQGIPLLADLPLLGRAFSSTDDTGSSTETIVLITPHIVAETGAGVDPLSRDKVDKAERILDLRGAVMDQKIERIAPDRVED